LIAHIGDTCRQSADAPILRTYWYDAAQDGIPTSEQLVIASLPFVKLRLGRLSGGHQKGGGRRRRSPPAEAWRVLRAGRRGTALVGFDPTERLTDEG